MTDKTLKILLGIIALNLTFLSVKEIGPTAHAQQNGATDREVRLAIYECLTRAAVSGSVGGAQRNMNFVILPQNLCLR
jgi:hypothetical protein